MGVCAKGPGLAPKTHLRPTNSVPVREMSLVGGTQQDWARSVKKRLVLVAFEGKPAEVLL